MQGGMWNRCARVWLIARQCYCEPGVPAPAFEKRLSWRAGALGTSRRGTENMIRGLVVPCNAMQ